MAVADRAAVLLLLPGALLVGGWRFFVLLAVQLVLNVGQLQQAGPALGTPGLQRAAQALG